MKHLMTPGSGRMIREVKQTVSTGSPNEWINVKDNL